MDGAPNGDAVHVDRNGNADVATKRVADSVAVSSVIKGSLDPDESQLHAAMSALRLCLRTMGFPRFATTNCFRDKLGDAIRRTSRAGSRQQLRKRIQFLDSWPMADVRATA
jgi:hypothetical protein